MSTVEVHNTPYGVDCRRIHQTVSTVAVCTGRSSPSCVDCWSTHQAVSIVEVILETVSSPFRRCDSVFYNHSLDRSVTEFRLNHFATVIDCIHLLVVRKCKLYNSDLFLRKHVASDWIRVKMYAICFRQRAKDKYAYLLDVICDN